MRLKRLKAGKILPRSKRRQELARHIEIGGSDKDENDDQSDKLYAEIVIVVQIVQAQC